MATKNHPNGYWTYETCYEEAKKYKSRRNFAKDSYGAYRVARKNGWLDDYTWFEKRFTWNRQSCYDEAKKYNSIKEFQIGSSGAYALSLKNGWLDDYTWLKRARVPNNHWNHDTCYEEAKKYKTKTDFIEKSNGAYTVALKNNWIDEYTWFINPRVKWTYETCFEESKKYKTKKEFKTGNQTAYNVANRNNWTDDYTWFILKNKPHGYWDYETCFEEAKKYKSRTELAHCNGSLYFTARKNGWLDDYTWLESLHVSNTYRYNLLEEFISEYEFRTFLENNDQNILLIIIRNLEPKYEPIKKDLEKALARTKETDPIKALRDKYMSDEEESDVNDETENTGEENVHDINTIDMDDDEAFKAVMTEITESSEESEDEEGEKEEKELSIDDVVKNDETELKVINKIEHMLTPEDRQYIMDKFLNDKRRQWMAEREKKSCNA